MMNGEKVVLGVEGKNLTIVCIVGSGRPPVETLVLSINGSNITNKGSDRIRYSFIPTKLDNMKLFTCSAYSSLLVNPLSCEVRLDIQYSPAVEIRRKLTKTKLILICNPSGNPDNFTFGDWEHWSEFKEHIRNVQGTSDGMLIMKYTTDKRLLETEDQEEKTKTKFCQQATQLVLKKKDKDTLSQENVSVLSDNSINDADKNDSIYEQPLEVQSRDDTGNVYLITKQNSIYENETFLDNSASQISSAFLRDTSPGEQELLVYENVVEEEPYLNYIADDIE
ncbi:Hypothetical predicted protein [Mytilus galloprovincialis]|uniref:Uncharacterized protein n=1 Tax=Mytilus galloprovincialis TaxID=29158 RepID=A0A8B6G1I1_MYTGA|nr:Hypothetical predicted protein [Mytilus galloprovincialis]